MRLVATVPNGSHSSDDLNLHWLLEHRGSFDAEVKEEVAAALGSNFVVTTSIAGGSVEVTAIIATVGVVYLSLSRYKSFVESLDLLVFHLRKVLSRFCEPRMRTVVGSWSPGTALDAAPPDPNADQPYAALNVVLVWYLVLTNAIFIGLLIWMTINKYSP